MTWAEFKALIDKQLAEKGIPEDTKLWYIDISFPSTDHEGKTPDVENNELGIAIS